MDTIPIDQAKHLVQNVAHSGRHGGRLDGQKVDDILIQSRIQNYLHIMGNIMMHCYLEHSMFQFLHMGCYSIADWAKSKKFLNTSSLQIDHPVRRDFWALLANIFVETLEEMEDVWHIRYSSHNFLLAKVFDE